RRDGAPGGRQGDGVSATPAKSTTRGLAAARRFYLVRLFGPADVHFAAHAGAVLVGLEAGGADAERRQFLVLFFGVAGDTDGADRVAARRADQHAAAFREDLVVGGGEQILHEGGLLLVADAHEARIAAERQRGVGLAVGHLEARHRAAVLL